MDEARLQGFMGRVVVDMGAAMNAPLVRIGEKVRLYRALAHAGPPSSQEVGPALGAQVGQARLMEVLEEGGFSRVRRATVTPFNLVLEAKR